MFNGSAFQGAVITNETILAYSVNPVDGSNRAFLGETIADSTGNFNLTLPTAPSGPMRLVSTGGNLMSVMNGAPIGTPADLSALFANASTSIANISINPLSEFVDLLTQGNLRVPGVTFSTAFAGAVAKIDSYYGLKADPATITPDYTAATLGSDAGNLGLILGAIINEDQYLCPPAPGTLVTSLAGDIADGVFDGMNFGAPIGYCGGDLAPVAGIAAMEDALAGLGQFGFITQGFAFGGKGNALTQNGLANLALNGKTAYPLTPLTTIETALGKAAPTPKNMFAPAADTATMNVGRFFETATVLPNGQVLLAGGIGGASNAVLASTEIYDPPTNSFLPPGSTPTMNAAREGSSATLLPGGSVLIAGGAGTNFTALVSTELYQSTTNTFAAAAGTATMNVARSRPFAVLLPNGLVLIAGGFGVTGTPLASTEVYNAINNSFATTGTAIMKTPRSDAAAVLMPNGKVLIAGGSGPTSALLASSEIYDPSTNTFESATPSMKTPRRAATATLLPNGKVLIAGGSTTGGFPVSSTELYDPTTNTFATGATPNMNTAREFATATLLPNGRVLIAGGDDGGSNNFSSTEVYDSLTNSFAGPEATASMTAGRTLAAAVMLDNDQVLIAGGFVALADPTTDLYTP
ncbi:MAG TPA: kelch repeat-containing protein [Candidatus Binataceae bacterium]|nr:kelch repeat-containing protein [Candidatus Binataceae bacterium]